MKPLFALALVCALLLVQPAFARSKPADPPAPGSELKRAVVVEDFAGAETVTGEVAASLTAMLIDDLVKDGRFIVVDKPSAAQQAQAQVAAATPATPDEDKAAAAALVPNLIVRGTVTKFEAAAKGSGIQVGGLPIGRGGRYGGDAGVSGQHALVALTLRLIDGSTGQVLASASASGTASSHTLQAGATDNASGGTAGVTHLSNTPVGKAADEAIHKAIDQIARAAQRIPWSAMVIDSEDGAVYINAGSDENLKAGTTLVVWRKKKVLTDPVSGAVLDVLMDRVGTVEVAEVRNRTSTAKKVDGDDAQKGDLVKLP
jgi:curli biogenesis system outer membrane secretion channel CsgG